MKKYPIFLIAIFMLVGFFAQAQTYTRTVTVEFDAAPSSYAVEIAKLKYNKEFAYSLTIDDGYIDVWNVAYPMVQGNPVLETDIYQGHNFGSGMPFQKINGYKFDDGCGNNVPFRFGLAINASQVGQTSDRLNWWHLSTLYGAGWDILNHGHFHDELPPIDFQDEIVQNAIEINNQIGFYPRHFAIPANQPAYAPATANHGMVATYGAVSGFEGVYNGGIWNVNGDISPIDNQLKLLRTSVPVDSASMNLQALKNKIHAVANWTPGQAVWYNEYTHAVGAGTNQYPNVSNMGFELLRDYLDFLQQDYGQKIWVAGLQEVEEYLFVRHHSVITNQVINGNTLTFDVTLNTSQPDQRHFDLSLLVGDANATITNITVEGNEMSSSNTESGLINLALVPAQCYDYTISGQTFFDTNVMAGPYNKITVQPGAILNITPGTELSFCENGELVIEPGGTVNFLGVFTSDTHWKGVRIQKSATQSGQFSSYQGALIERADFGIFTDANGSFSSDHVPVVCERTTFKNCHQGVSISNNNAAFYQCVFMNNADFSHPFGFSAFAKLTNISGEGVLFSNCKLAENRPGFSLYNNGIIAENAIYRVE